MLRSIFMTALVLGCLPFIVVKPHFGVLVFSWLSYMNPHHYVWGFAADFRFVLLVGAVTVVAWLLSREPKRLPWNTVTVLLAAFMLWISFTTLFMIYPEVGYPKWERAIKVLFFNGFVTVGLITSRRRVHLLIWVIVASIAFFAVKGGIFVLLTGGESRVRGPDDSFFGDNNHLAVALLMILPLMRYLQLNTKKPWIRWGLIGGMILLLISVVGTQSRGALVGLIVVGAYLAMKMRRRILIGAVLVATVLATINFMPEKWHERMASIQEYSTDKSALGRLESWGYAIDLAARRPFVGGGFGAFAGNLRVDSETKFWTAHSIYFEILGAHGYVGLVLFLLLGVATFRAGSWIRRHSNGDPRLTWARDLAAMLQVSLIAFATAGAFLNMAFFDLFYHVVALMVATKVIVHAELRRLPELLEPGGQVPAAGTPGEVAADALARSR